MWQLLGLDLATTGFLLQFWLQTVPGPFGPLGAENNSFLILFVPLFLGIFTASALLKHRFFCELELERAVVLDHELGFQRDSEFTKKYYRSFPRFVRSFDMAMLAVLATSAGIALLIGRSFWIKPPILAGHLFWFPLYLVAVLAAPIGYGAWRKLGLNRERRRQNIESLIPLTGRKATIFWTGYITSIILLAIGLVAMWWGL